MNQPRSTENPPDRELYVGVMSGTSMDGVDAVLADLSSGRARLVGHVRRAFAPELLTALAQLQSPGDNELDRAAIAAQHLARAYALAIDDLLRHCGVEAEQVCAAGVHGQTVRHRPEAGYTIQLNAPATVAELCGIDVVADFRSRDIAAGGQGAPLVPAFHAAMFQGTIALALVNIGGIANLSLLPPLGAAMPVSGFDCGPGNVLMDLWAQRHLATPYDADGAWAAQGQVHEELLQTLCAEPYLLREPPKSTGRDLFNAQWLDRKRHGCDPGAAIAPVDVQATLARYTAHTIADALRRHHPEAEELIVCGGGAFNGCLMRLLAQECAPIPVVSSAERGIEPHHVEALAFAWLAREHMLGRAASLPAVTGARGERILGARYPR